MANHCLGKKDSYFGFDKDTATAVYVKSTGGEAAHKTIHCSRRGVLNSVFVLPSSGTVLGQCVHLSSFGVS